MVKNKRDYRVMHPEPHWHGSDRRQIYQALLDLQTQCFKVATALADGLAVEIETAASELAAAWFDATAVIRTIHARSVSAPDVGRRGVLALRVTHQVLSDFFELDLPLPADERSRLRAVLCRLTLRMGHVLDILAETGPIASASDYTSARGHIRRDEAEVQSVGLLPRSG